MPSWMTPRPYGGSIRIYHHREAARVIPMEIQKKFSDVPWGKMQGIRNVLVHEYFRLDEEILWEASQNDIPPLIAALEKINQSNR